MRIAVACEGLDVASNFSHCSSFMCYTVNRGIITECQNMPNLGLSVGKLVPLLAELGIATLIVGCIEYDSACVFCDADIEIVAGVKGSAREVTEAYLAQTLIGTDELCRTDNEEDFELASF